MNILQCDYCLKSPKKFFITCAECRNVKLCLLCFSCGCEAGCHMRTHRYSIKCCNYLESLSLFKQWTDSDELDLLDAIETYGLGNWEDVAERCVNKSPNECLQHYINSYLHGCLASVNKMNTKKALKVTEHETPSSPPTDEKRKGLPRLDLPDQQILGYHEFRDDFDMEYDNDAESLLSCLRANHDSDELQKELHIAHVNIYTQRLKERQKRKSIARDHGLIQHIFAYLMNKRTIRRQPLGVGIKHTSNNIHTPSKYELIAPLSPNIKICKRQFLRSTSEKRSLTKILASPPAGSWLAAPYAIQLRGPSRGIPLVKPDVCFSPEKNSNQLFHFTPNINYPTYDLDTYDPFNINEKLKPFLRYFTPSQAKKFIDNLYREELLKHEIKYLLNIIHKLRAGSKCPKLKPLQLHSQVYVPAPPLQFVPPSHPSAWSSLTNKVKPAKKRRRHSTAPWYVKQARAYKKRR